MFGTKKTLFILFCIGVGIVPLVAQPTLFEARSGPDGAILLKWNGSGLFTVYRSQEDLFETAEEIAQVKGTSYTDYPDTNGTTYYYWVCVLSETGDEGPPSPSAYAVCDREAPGIVIASPLNGAHIHGALTVEGTASDVETGVTQVEVSINGVWYKSSGTSTWHLSIKDPPEGEVTLICRAHDAAGNSTEESITVFMESESPSITGITPTETMVNTETTAEISGENFVETPQVLMGSTACDVTWDSDTALLISIPPLDEGVYDVTVINPDGKSDTLSGAFSVYVPNKPPEILCVNAVPHFVPNNGTTTTLLTAQVEDIDDNIDTVVIDLTSISLGKTSMKDDGLHPDKIAGDSIYSAETVISKKVAEGEYALPVTATDEYGAVDTASLAITVVKDPPDNPPDLTNYQVSPSSGTTTTIFRYTVTYSDEDNNAPTYVQITITGVGTFNMVEVDPDDHYYVDGKNYYYEYSGGLAPGTHSYTISASDGTNPVSLGATGPDVSGPNTPPVLSNDSVTPSSGTQTTNFRYKVTYTDDDNDDPVSLVLDITGVGTFNMVELDPSDDYYKNGKVYYYDYTAGLTVGTHSYTITADDGTDTTSKGGTGPTVTADSNTPPVLSNDSVTPSSGTQTTNFRYKVTYTDDDNDDPVSLVLDITGVGTFNMVELDPSDDYYKNGKVYYYDYTAGLTVGTHSYTITADDGTDTTSKGGTGPTVTADSNTPPVLSNDSVTPECGNTSTVFIYEVTYTDGDNDDPVSLVLDIAGVGTFNMVELDPSDQNFQNGKIYYYVYTGGFPIGTHSYTITADDGTDTTSKGGTGPEIPVGDCEPPSPPSPPPSPVINIYPISGSVRTWVTISGTYFGSHEDNITVTFAGTPVHLTPLGSTSYGSSPGTVKANASGAFSAKFKVPISKPGSKTVDAYGETTSASSVPNRIFTVICIPPPPYPPSSGFQPPTDTVSPQSVITYPQTNAKLKGNYITVRGSASDNNKVVKVEVSFDNGVTWHTTSGTTTWSYQWRLPTDGIYTVRSKATDDEGNTELVGDRITVIIDNTPPEATITTELESITSVTEFELTGTIIDNDMVKRAEITTDGGDTWTPLQVNGKWTYPWTPSDGEYIIQVRAWDDVGHSGYSEQISVIIDTTSPDLYIDTPDRTQVTEGTFIIMGRASDKNGVKSVQISINEQAFENVTGIESWQYTWVVPDTPGEYIIEVKAVDNAGNETSRQISLIVGAPSEGGVLPGIFSQFYVLLMVAGIVIAAAVILLVIYFRG